jgi:hypothetical protein
MKTPTSTRTMKLLALFLSVSLLGACTSGPQAAQPNERQAKAMAMWQERCKTAGDKIYKTVDNVEGVYLMKLRPNGVNYGDQFKLDDPYGSDLLGDGYLASLLRGSYEANLRSSDKSPPPSMGYLYVEAQDPKDGQRYRYTGRVEEPWQTNKSYFKGYTRFVLDKVPAPVNLPRYGVTYDDISTREEREYWIAGSSLKVIDLQTNEVLAERIGYMVDWAQGSQVGGRSPWLFAADNACPEFASRHGASAQSRQTQRFVEKVLKPSR